MQLTTREIFELVGFKRVKAAFKGNQGWLMVSGLKEGANAWVDPSTSAQVGPTKGYKVAPANGSGVFILQKN